MTEKTSWKDIVKKAKKLPPGPHIVDGVHVVVTASGKVLRD